MKLKFIAHLSTWHDPIWDKFPNQVEMDLEQFHISFLLKNKKLEDDLLIIPVEIDVPNVQVCRDERGVINKYMDEKSLEKAYEVSTYLADVLHLQTGFCELRDKPRPKEYIPENQQEAQELKNSNQVEMQELVTSWHVHGLADLSSQAISKYWKHRRLINIRASAKRLKDPISKYVELYRALEYCQAEIKRQARRKGQFEENYVAQLIAQLTGLSLNDLRELRNRCAHAYDNFVTHGYLEKLQEVEQALPNLEKAIKKIEEELLKSSSES